MRVLGRKKCNLFLQEKSQSARGTAQVQAPCQACPEAGAHVPAEGCQAHAGGVTLPLKYLQGGYSAKIHQCYLNACGLNIET